ncbi:MAG: AbrB/MazE/SpoVT family DNA-binding domain-containing protein [Comamonas sp.]|jgi:antitoxin MazE|nr:AbrB/MazE/SpoVT family DNA-binding domain-containing protein [Comamonas sp.]
MHLRIRAARSNKEIVLPRALLAQAGMATATVANVNVVDGAIVIKAQTALRSGWAEAAKMLAQSQNDRLVLGEFSNVADADLAWTNEAPSAQVTQEPVEW